jgi:ubiquinone/menaquinone biosynthesis C-methylase UbiE
MPKLTKQQLKQCEQAADELLKNIDDQSTDVVSNHVDFNNIKTFDLAIDETYRLLKEKLGAK